MWRCRHRPARIPVISGRSAKPRMDSHCTNPPKYFGLEVWCPGRRVWGVPCVASREGEMTIRTIALAAVAALALTGPAIASDATGWYIGVAAGYDHMGGI